MHRAVRVLSATLAVVALAGCGSDDKKTPSDGGTATPGSSTATLEAVQFSFTPTKIDLDAGKSTLDVTNSDKVEHNLTIEDLGVDQDLDAGKSVKVTVDAKAGTYSFRCKYHPSQMKGTITVG